MHITFHDLQGHPFDEQLSFPIHSQNELVPADGGPGLRSTSPDKRISSFMLTKFDSLQRHPQVRQLFFPIWQNELVPADNGPGLRSISPHNRISSFLLIKLTQNAPQNRRASDHCFELVGTALGLP